MFCFVVFGVFGLVVVNGCMWVLLLLGFGCVIVVCWERLVVGSCLVVEVV